MIMANVLIQCRTTSSRLPGKAFLTINDIPSVVLCAKRLQNKGLAARVLTSDQKEDDQLVKLLQSHSIECFRGPLNDVLGRFYLAAKELNPDTPIIRMTADNLFPDGDFLEKCLRAFSGSKNSYMTTMSPEENPLPYGLVAEIFTFELLKDAHEKSQNDFEREHVTHYMRRNLNQNNMINFHDDYSGMRCTLDSLDDYLRILDVFEGQNAVCVHWKELCDALKIREAPKLRMPSKILHCKNIPTCSLGTAQLGLSYGITNKAGKPDKKKAEEILSLACAHGISLWDTAEAYGTSETVVGDYWKKTKSEEVTIITKLQPLNDLIQENGEHLIETQVRKSIYQSCLNLGKKPLDYLLLHNWRDYNSANGAAWQTLMRLKDEGYINRLGASIYTEDELKQALEDNNIEFIQLPFNILDRRYQKAGLIPAIMDRKARGKNELIIQARSVFLQGLLVNETATPPNIKGFNQKRLLEKLDFYVEKFNRKSRRDLCVSYVRAQEWVDTIVLGMENAEQVIENSALFYEQPLSPKQCDELEEEFCEISSDLLNPSKWSYK